MAAKPTSAPAYQPPDLSSLGLAITEHAPLPMATVEGASHIVRYVNPAFCRLMDKPTEQLVGKPFDEMMPEKDECLTLLDRVYRTGKSESHTEQQHSKPHPVFWSYTMWPVRADERPVGVMIQVTETAQFHEKTLAMNEALMLGSVRQHKLTEAADSSNAQLQEEIAERKQTEAALKESQERYRVLFSALPVAAFVCDRDATIQYYNRRATELWQRKPKAGVEQHCGSMKLYLKDGALLPHAQSPMMEVMRTGIPARNVEVFIERPDGSRIPVIVNFAALKNAQGEIVGSVTSFDDITERKQAEEALALARMQLADRAKQLEGLVAERTGELTATNKQLEAFVYSIAHDLRAPLRSMQGFSAMLAEDAGTALSETGRDFANRINKSAQFMDALLQDLLAFSRIAQQQIELTSVNLETVVQSVLSRLEKEIQEKNGRVEIAGPWPTVLAHEPTLGQVLTNLVSNALKFVRPDAPPQIRLRAQEQGRLVRVWVEDNGIGIAPDHQDQIFRLFTRLHGDKFPGTGIGLAIVQEGVERMDGNMGLDSTPGQGSRFWFELRKAGKI